MQSYKEGESRVQQMIMGAGKTTVVWLPMGPVCLIVCFGVQHMYCIDPLFVIDDRQCLGIGVNVAWPQQSQNTETPLGVPPDTLASCCGLCCVLLAPWQLVSVVPTGWKKGQQNSVQKSKKGVCVCVGQPPSAPQLRHTDLWRF